MMNHFKYLVAAACILCGGAARSFAAESARSDSVSHNVVRKSEVSPRVAGPEDLVIVNGDTVPVFIPAKNYGRFDRGLYNYMYIPKREWAIALTASYGELNTEDIRLLDVVGDLDFKGDLLAVRPSVAYFFDHNQSVGVRVTYTRGRADLASMSVDFGDDLSFSLRDVSYHTHKLQCGIFYRNYVGLGRDKRFAVFNEVALNYGNGTSRFKRYYGDVLYNTRTTTSSASLDFSPGVCAFLYDNVAFNVSFGVFGVKYNHDRQRTNGADDGSRTSSGANFRFNIFNIDFGLMVVI